MMYNLNTVFILMTMNMMVDSAPRIPDVIEWSVENQFCGSSIPIIMGLICKLPDQIPKTAKDTINQGGRVRRGIVEDCCRRPCTPIYMQSYCHEDLEKVSTDQPIIK